MEPVRSESDALKACSGIFVKRVQEECGLLVHHVEAASRKKSCMSVETRNGRIKQVPVLSVYFMDESYRKAADDRGSLSDGLSEQLRKIWQETTIPYGLYLNRKDYCDSGMFIRAVYFEQRCFYDYITNRQSEITALLKSRLGVSPEKLYPAHEGLSIVFSKSDYIEHGIEAEAESLKQEIAAQADRYITGKYHEKIGNASYIRFLHPEMPGYNGYGLWLG